MLISIKALLLVLVANSAPILIQKIPVVARWDFPLDWHVHFIDGRRLLGKSKTWRGFISAIILTTIVSGILQAGWSTGAAVGTLAMLGDSLSSFIKRRLALPPSAMAIGIDQIPESLLPLAYLHLGWQLGWWQVSVLVVVFIVLELGLSRVLYRLHIRKHPY